MNEHLLSAEYISALEARDEGVLPRIEKSYSRLMKSMGRRLAMSENDIEECVSDALFELWNTIPPAKPASIRTYVCRLMRSAVVDKIRYNSAGKRSGTVLLDTELELADLINTEDTVIDRLTLRDLLNEFLNMQTPKNREIFIRRYYEFESTRSIATDLLMTDATVRKRLSRMREELKRTLTEWGYEHEK
ncbi:MAG: sigma-70 family RNA polymerase sigma factor [Clostridia bacterium]|nr:sigma-70 family RNA polymerase sigma factor [Clostridia bacterium]